MIHKLARLHHLFTLIGLVLAVFALSSCSEFRLLSEGAKLIKGSADPTPAQYNLEGLALITEGEYYKVGSPYQIKGKWYYPKVDYNYSEEGIASWYGPGFHNKRTANGAKYNQRDITAAHRTLPMPSLVRVTNLENGRSLVVKINDRGPFARNRIIDLSERAAEILDVKAKGTALVRVDILPYESQRIAQLMGAEPAAKFADVSNAPAQPAPAATPAVKVSSQPIAPPQGAQQIDNQNNQQLTQNTQVQAADNRPTLSRISDLETTANVNQANDPDPQIFVQAGAFGLYENANKVKTLIEGQNVPVMIQQFNQSERPLFRVRVGPTYKTEIADKYLDIVNSLGFDDAQIITVNDG